MTRAMAFAFTWDGSAPRLFTAVDARSFTTSSNVLTRSTNSSSRKVSASPLSGAHSVRSAACYCAQINQ